MNPWQTSQPLRAALRAVVLGLTLLGAATPPSVQAQPRDEYRGPPPRWHHGDMRDFRRYDLEVWRHGYWIHDHYRGRSGWWWVVGGQYYWYPNRIDPFPDPFIPPGGITSGVPVPPGELWYYCDAVRTYYPYAATCPGPWRAVPATR
jgi:hypothetical protein